MAGVWKHLSSAWRAMLVDESVCMPADDPRHGFSSIVAQWPLVSCIWTGLSADEHVPLFPLFGFPSKDGAQPMAHLETARSLLGVWQNKQTQVSQFQILLL